MVRSAIGGIDFWVSLSDDQLKELAIDGKFKNKRKSLEVKVQKSVMDTLQQFEEDNKMKPGTATKLLVSIRNFEISNTLPIGSVTKEYVALRNYEKANNLVKGMGTIEVVNSSEGGIDNWCLWKDPQ